MHLQPIERPRGLLMRIAYRVSRRRFGKVIAPFKVIYARKPRFLVIAGQIQGAMESLSLDPALRLLVQVQAARMNGCVFCEDMALAQAAQRKVGIDRFRALDEFRTSPLFTPRERAALAFAEEATRDRHVSDATWAEVRAHFTDEEIVELTWVNAAENYFNLQAHVLGLGSDELLARATAP
ncbi:MAG TPA: carboxymuconolactone decarboxylase family protein [Longimicrobium sp.]|nr:carboxymuconolactone decarboxylase family protein [Longimicrobium sp.]